MVDIARVNVPSATFIHDNIISVDFIPSYFDAVVAFYSIFHLPREKHLELFRHIHRWLKPGGYLMVTLSFKNEPAYLEKDFFGIPMYWSNYGLDEYKGILELVGFKIHEVTTIDHGYEETLQSTEESHPLVFAKKIN
jgi:SAM-dependent methyltransferase